MKQTAYIFDVDGVLNDPRVYELDLRIISHIATLLDAGTFVAINTGRGYDWVEANVVRALRQSVTSPKSLARLFVAVEMGGLGIKFADDKEQKTRSAFSLRPEQIAQVRSVFEAHPEYADRLHWYGKESMATLEKKHGTAMEAFRPAQKRLAAILKEVFKGQHVQVANSNDAIDVHAPEAGKWAGAQLIYAWLSHNTNVPHDQFVCFGDSMVDYEMARFFAEQSHDTIFVFTGPVFDASRTDPNITVVKTALPYNEGAYQYLKESLKN